MKHIRVCFIGKLSVFGGEIFYIFELACFPNETKTDTFNKSVVPDETARNESSHQYLPCLPSCFNFRLKLLFSLVDYPISRMEQSS